MATSAGTSSSLLHGRFSEPTASVFLDDLESRVSISSAILVHTSHWIDANKRFFLFFSRYGPGQVDTLSPIHAVFFHNLHTPLYKRTLVA